MAVHYFDLLSITLITVNAFSTKSISIRQQWIPIDTNQPQFMQMKAYKRLAFNAKTPRIHSMLQRSIAATKPQGHQPSTNAGQSLQKPPVFEFISGEITCP